MAAHNKINQLGKRFGRLLVVDVAESYVSAAGKKKSRWKCKCDCGNNVVVMGTGLMSGYTRSCGCFNKDRVSDTKRKHSMCESPVYETWTYMLQRCRNKNVKEYKHYGARGITVCDRWLTFKNFYDDMGDRPEGKSIDRIDVNGNYEPNNCRWATHKEQCRNRRSNNVIEFNGQKRCLSEWAEFIGIHRSTLRCRLDSLPLDIAMTLPPRKSRGQIKELPPDPKE